MFVKGLVIFCISEGQRDGRENNQCHKPSLKRYVGKGMKKNNTLCNFSHIFTKLFLKANLFLAMNFAKRVIHFTRSWQCVVFQYVLVVDSG
jgi:hypothetical protein